MEMLGVQHAEFYVDSVEVRTAEGAINYLDKEFVRITNPGGKDVVEREVQEKDKIFWMAQYKAFKDGVEYEGDGFKLKDTSFLSKSEIDMCRKARIYTVEQLAAVEENGAKALGLNALVLIEKAKNWLKGRNGTDALVNQINALEQRLNSQADILTDLKIAKAEIASKDDRIKELENKIEEILKEDKKGKK